MAELKASAKLLNEIDNYDALKKNENDSFNHTKVELHTKDNKYIN